MERNEKPNDPNDPRQYLVTPLAGPILIGQTIIVVMLMALCLGIGDAGNYLYHTVADTAIKYIAVAIMAIGGGAAIAVLVLGVRGMRSDARRYWLRNVRGYRLACWISRPHPQYVAYLVIAPGAAVPRCPQYGDEVMLVLPIGGWFRMPTVAMPKGQALSWPLKRGQLRLRDGLLRLGPYPAMLPHSAIAGQLIQLRDHHGDRLTMSVENAIKLFEQHALCVCTNQGAGLRGVVEDYQRAAEQTKRERAHEQDARRNADHALTSALIVMQQTVVEIAKTSRFVGSIEALRIRLFLLERFRELVPTPDPKEPQRAKWIGWADEEIASARADLARRDRHRRRPSVGAGT